jgi:hypothetical protein
MVLPRLYAIADVGTLVRAGISLRAFAEELREAGVTLVRCTALWRLAGFLRGRVRR